MNGPDLNGLGRELNACIRDALYLTTDPKAHAALLRARDLLRVIEQGAADPNEDPETLLTVRQAATRLAVSLSYVYTHLEDGRMRGIRQGHRWLIKVGDLRAYAADLRGF